MLSPASRRLAGILLVVFPSVILGGASLLSMLIRSEPGYVDNPIRQDLWRAGHAHAGVLLILSLVILRYVDEAVLSDRVKAFVRVSAPTAAILLPLAYFLSVLSPAATQPSGIVYLAFAGAVILGLGLTLIGVGLIRRPGS
jgi:hypothetical protein